MPDVNSIVDGVYRILTSDIRARNDDKWLCYKFVREIDGIRMFIPFEDFQRMTAFETITRVRRHIQHDNHELLPTDPRVARERKLNMELWREQSLKWKKEAIQHD